MSVRKMVLLMISLSLPALLDAQISWKWTPVQIDGTYDEIKDTTATHIIGRYSDLIEPLQEIVGYSDKEYSKKKPESGLSNMAADIIRFRAEKESGVSVDVALTNFGGIRTNLPKGAVRVYDILSIFPFNNTIVYFDIKGSDLRKVFHQMIGRGNIEALSNVRLVVDGRKAVSIDVGGEPLDDAKMYKFATINFLMDGGDGVVLIDVAQNLKDTKVLIRDAVVDYLKEQMNRGETIKLKNDGRVKYVNDGRTVR